MPSPTKNNVVHSGAGSTRFHIRVPNPLPVTAPPGKNSWDGNVPLALKEHRQNETSSLSSTGFWRLLAADTVTGHAVALGVVCVVCVEQLAPACSNEKQEQEEVAPWREISICEDK